MTNITVDKTELWKAFGLINLMPLAVADPKQLPAPAEKAFADKNIDVHPKLDQNAIERAVTWKFQHVVIAHNKDKRKALTDLVQTAIGLVPNMVRASSGDFTGSFASGHAIVSLMYTIVSSIIELVENNKAQDVIAAKTFNVTFQRDAGDTSDKVVGYRLYLHSRWLSTDITDPQDDNGHNRCQGLWVNNNQKSFARVRSRASHTDVYHNLLGERTYPLRADQTSHQVKFEIKTAAQTDWNLFVNLNSSVTLRIYIADNMDELTKLMNPEEVANIFLEDGTELVASTDAPETVDPALIDVPDVLSEVAVALNAPGAPLAPSAPLNVAAPALVHLPLAMTVVPLNDRAARFLAHLSDGKIPHVGLHLSKQQPEELFVLAQGLGVPAQMMADMSAVGLAQAILKHLGSAH